MERVRVGVGIGVGIGVRVRVRVRVRVGVEHLLVAEAEVGASEDTHAAAGQRRLVRVGVRVKVSVQG